MRRHRQARDLSQAQLGKHIGIDRFQVCKLEAGRRSIDLELLGRAAGALGTSLRVLLGL